MVVASVVGTVVITVVCTVVASVVGTVVITVVGTVVASVVGTVGIFAGEESSSVPPSSAAAPAANNNAKTISTNRYFLVNTHFPKCTKNRSQENIKSCGWKITLPSLPEHRQ